MALWSGLLHLVTWKELKWDRPFTYFVFGAVLRVLKLECPQIEQVNVVVLMLASIHFKLVSWLGATWVCWLFLEGEQQGRQYFKQWLRKTISQKLIETINSVVLFIVISTKFKVVYMALRNLDIPWDNTND